MGMATSVDCQHLGDRNWSKSGLCFAGLTSAWVIPRGEFSRVVDSGRTVSNFPNYSVPGFSYEEILHPSERKAADQFGTDLCRPHSAPRPQEISTSATLGPSRHEIPVIIWDWDDTLMYSTALTMNSNKVPMHKAQEFEMQLEKVLCLSIGLGDTYIVTNADESWVFESARRFAPRVYPLLSQMRVMSARLRYEHSYPRDVFAWKRETFREVLATRGNVWCPRGKYWYSKRGMLNLVVLGDSMAEMEAAHSSTHGLFPTVKTVKFVDRPSLDDLLTQLRRVAGDLAGIVAEDKSVNRKLNIPMAANRFDPLPHLQIIAPQYFVPSSGGLGGDSRFKTSAW